MYQFLRTMLSQCKIFVIKLDLVHTAHCTRCIGFNTTIFFSVCEEHFSLNDFKRAQWTKLCLNQLFIYFWSKNNFTVFTLYIKRIVKFGGTQKNRTQLDFRFLVILVPFALKIVLTNFIIICQQIKLKIKISDWL